MNTPEQLTKAAADLEAVWDAAMGEVERAAWISMAAHPLDETSPEAGAIFLLALIRERQYAGAGLTAQAHRYLCLATATLLRAQAATGWLE